MAKRKRKIVAVENIDYLFTEEEFIGYRYNMAELEKAAPTAFYAGPLRAKFKNAVVF